MSEIYSYYDKFKQDAIKTLICPHIYFHMKVAKKKKQPLS